MNDDTLDYINSLPALPNPTVNSLRGTSYAYSQLSHAMNTNPTPTLSKGSNTNLDDPTPFHVPLSPIPHHRMGGGDHNQQQQQQQQQQQEYTIPQRNLGGHYQTTSQQMFDYLNMTANYDIPADNNYTSPSDDMSIDLPMPVERFLYSGRNNDNHNRNYNTDQHYDAENNNGYLPNLNTNNITTTGPPWKQYNRLSLQGATVSGLPQRVTTTATKPSTTAITNRNTQNNANNNQHYQYQHQDEKLLPKPPILETRQQAQRAKLTHNSTSLAVKPQRIVTTTAVQPSYQHQQQQQHKPPSSVLTRQLPSISNTHQSHAQMRNTRSIVPVNKLATPRKTTDTGAIRSSNIQGGSLHSQARQTTFSSSLTRTSTLNNQQTRRTTNNNPNKPRSTLNRQSTKNINTKSKQTDDQLSQKQPQQSQNYQNTTSRNTTNTNTNGRIEEDYKQQQKQQQLDANGAKFKAFLDTDKRLQDELFLQRQQQQFLDEYTAYIDKFSLCHNIMEELIQHTTKWSTPSLIAKYRELSTNIRPVLEKTPKMLYINRDPAHLRKFSLLFALVAKLLEVEFGKLYHLNTMYSPHCDRPVLYAFLTVLTNDIVPLMFHVDLGSLDSIISQTDSLSTTNSKLYNVHHSRLTAYGSITAGIGITNHDTSAILNDNTTRDECIVNLFFNQLDFVRIIVPQLMLLFDDVNNRTYEYVNQIITMIIKSAATAKRSNDNNQNNIITTLFISLIHFICDYQPENLYQLDHYYNNYLMSNNPAASPDEIINLRPYYFDPISLTSNLLPLTQAMSLVLTHCPVQYFTSLFDQPITRSAAGLLFSPNKTYMKSSSPNGSPTATTTTMTLSAFITRLSKLLQYQQQFVQICKSQLLDIVHKRYTLTNDYNIYEENYIYFPGTAQFVIDRLTALSSDLEFGSVNCIEKIEDQFSSQIKDIFRSEPPQFAQLNEQLPLDCLKRAVAQCNKRLCHKLGFQAPKLNEPQPNHNSNNNGGGGYHQSANQIPSKQTYGLGDNGQDKNRTGLLFSPESFGSSSNNDLSYGPATTYNSTTKLGYPAMNKSYHTAGHQYNDPLMPDIKPAPMNRTTIHTANNNNKNNGNQPHSLYLMQGSTLPQQSNQTAPPTNNRITMNKSGNNHNLPTHGNKTITPIKHKPIVPLNLRNKSFEDVRNTLYRSLRKLPFHPRQISPEDLPLIQAHLGEVKDWLEKTPSESVPRDKMDFLASFILTTLTEPTLIANIPTRTEQQHRERGYPNEDRTKLTENDLMDDHSFYPGQKHQREQHHHPSHNNMISPQSTERSDDNDPIVPGHPLYYPAETLGAIQSCLDTVFKTTPISLNHLSRLTIAAISHSDPYKELIAMSTTGKKDGMNSDNDHYSQNSLNNNPEFKSIGTELSLHSHIQPNIVPLNVEPQLILVKNLSNLPPPTSTHKNGLFKTPEEYKDYKNRLSSMVKDDLVDHLALLSYHTIPCETASYDHKQPARQYSLISHSAQQILDANHVDGRKRCAPTSHDHIKPFEQPNKTNLNKNQTMDMSLGHNQSMTRPQEPSQQQPQQHLYSEYQRPAIPRFPQGMATGQPPHQPPNQLPQAPSSQRISQFQQPSSLLHHFDLDETTSPDLTQFYNKTSTSAFPPSSSSQNKSNHNHGSLSNHNKTNFQPHQHNQSQAPFQNPSSLAKFSVNQPITLEMLINSPDTSSLSSSSSSASSSFAPPLAAAKDGLEPLGSSLNLHAFNLRTAFALPSLPPGAPVRTTSAQPLSLSSNNQSSNARLGHPSKPMTIQQSKPTLSSTTIRPTTAIVGSTALTRPPGITTISSSRPSQPSSSSAAPQAPEPLQNPNKPPALRQQPAQPPQSQYQHSTRPFQPMTSKPITTRVLPPTIKPPAHTTGTNTTTRPTTASRPLVPLSSTHRSNNISQPQPKNHASGGKYQPLVEPIRKPKLDQTAAQLDLKGYMGGPFLRSQLERAPYETTPVLREQHCFVGDVRGNH